MIAEDKAKRVEELASKAENKLREKERTIAEKEQIQKEKEEKNEKSNNAGVVLIDDTCAQYLFKRNRLSQIV